MKLLVLIALALMPPLVACGLLGGFAAHAGIERADDPAAKELAMKADQATKNWLDYLIYGVLPLAGYGAGREHQRRRHKTTKPA